MSKLKFSVTHVMLPQYDIEETCKLLSELGFDGVEWRVFDNPEEDFRKGAWKFWGAYKANITPANLKQRAKEIRKICNDFGLAIPALATYVRANELEKLKNLAEAVASLGSPLPAMRVNAPRNYDGKTNYNELFKEAVDCYGKAIDVLKDYNIRALIETHNHTIFVSASLAHRLCSNFPPERIGVIYDIQNMIMDGYETPRLAMELLGPYFQHCHIGGHRPVLVMDEQSKKRKWQWERCDLSEGFLDVPSLLSDMMAVKYDKFLSIEDFRADVESRELLANQIAYLKNIVKNIEG